MLNVRISSGIAAYASVKNISSGGICVTTHIPLPRGKFIKLIFTLPDGTEMQMNGSVAWSLATDSSIYENGIDFLQIRASYKERLSRFLN